MPALHSPHLFSTQNTPWSGLEGIRQTLGELNRVNTVTVTPEQARHFLISALGLEGFQKEATVADAIHRLETVQEDSINICGRIHDLILWSRVREYTPELLAQALYGPDAMAFEYWFPNLHIVPLADYHHFVGQMRERASAPGRWRMLSEEEKPVAEKFLAALDERGPLRTRAHGNEDGHTMSGWGTRATVVSQVAEKLWIHGRLSIAKRENFERYFDRTERVYPTMAAYHETDATLPDPEETERHLMRKRLRASRLFKARKGVTDILEKDALTAVQITGVKRKWYCLTEDVDRLTQAAPPPAEDALLLAPLEPLIYDRDRNRELFGFDYTWEVYTPAAKRRWGYYVLPILFGDRLVGRVDPKVDRKARALHILSLTLEPGVDAAVVAQPIADRLQAYARFLGADRVLPSDTVPAEIRKLLE